MKKVSLIGIIVTIASIVSLPSSSFAVVDDQGNPLVDSSPSYTANELIIKFKSQNDINTVQNCLQNQSTCNSTPLGQLVLQYGTQKMTKVFPSGMPTQQQLKTKFPNRKVVNGMAVPDLSLTECVLFQGNVDVPALARQFAALTDSVVYAEPNYTAELLSLPNDTYVDSDQNGTWSTGAWGQTFEDMWGLKKINMQSAWDATQTNTTPIIVAISDSGVDYNHEDIKNQTGGAGNMWVNSFEDINHNGMMDGVNHCPQVLSDSGDFNCVDDDSPPNGYIDDIYGFDFIHSQDNNSDGDYNDVGDVSDPQPTDGYGHGTHVAGTVAATTNNSKGVASVSRYSKILVAQGFSEVGAGDTCKLSQGIVYATNNGARVISMSWVEFEYSQTLADAVNYAYGNGTVLVAGAGNNHSDAYGYYPCSLEHVICAGAVDQNDNLAGFSNFGQYVDVVAPGVDILSLRAFGTDIYKDGRHIVNTNYYRANGTSMATPHTSGLAALILSVNPNLSADIVASILEASAQTISSGYQRIDANAAVTEAKNGSIGFWGELLVYETNFAVAQILSATQFTLDFKLENAGSASQNNVLYRVYANSIAPGNLLEESSVNFSSNQVVSFNKTYTMTALPSKVIIQIDPNNTVVEYNEQNNQAAITLSVPYLQNWPQDIYGLQETTPVIADLDPNYPGAEIIGASDGGVYVWHADGTLMAGWPQYQDASASITSSPVVVDLDGDGSLEVIAGCDGTGSFDANFYIWHSDGSRASGWPKAIAGASAAADSPAVTDLDGDGRLEIIAVFSKSGTNNGSVIHAWHSDGSEVSGWPKDLDSRVSSAPVAGDFSSDPLHHGKEIILGSSSGKVYCWHADGTDVAGWPKVLEGSTDYSVALADLDGNGTLDMIVNVKKTSASDVIYAFKEDGSALLGWGPLNVNDEISASPVVGDVDHDGSPEVFVSSGTTHKIYAWYVNGTPLAGWPQTTEDDTRNLSFADLDGDGTLEILCMTKNGQVYAWSYQDKDGDGFADVVPGWPERIFGNNSQSVSVGDLNGDGKLEVVAASDNKLSIWTLPWAVSDRMPWPKYHKDLGNTNYIKDAVSYLSGWPQTTDQEIVSTPVFGDFDPSAPGIETIGASDNGYIYVWKSDGTLLPGWPKWVPVGLHPNLIASPVLVDIDSSVEGLELIVATGLGDIYIWHSDGTDVFGWPRRESKMIFSSPTIADLDNDGSPEIIVGLLGEVSGTYNLNAYHSDGTLVAGWPVLPGVSVASSAAVADLDGDGDSEIVIGADDYKVYAFHADGTSVAGWPKTTLGYVRATPALADLDGDGKLEVIVGSFAFDTKVYAWHNDGSTVSGWPQNVGSWVNSSAAVADVDLSYPGLEIFVQSYNNKVHAFHADGSVLPGWPMDMRNNFSNSLVGPSLYFQSSPSLVDVDGDSYLDILVGYHGSSTDGALHAWHYNDADNNGQADSVLGFPLSVAGGVDTSPVLSDINGDGTLEVAVGAWDGKMYLWSLPWISANRNPWPTFQKNVSHTGSNVAPVLSPVGNKTASTQAILTFTLEAKDIDNDGLTYSVASSAGTMPTGASVNAHTGVFYWTPALNQAGIYTFTFTVKDIHDASDSETITVTVQKVGGGGRGGGKGKNVY